jgi:hypothetical protein
MAHQLDLEAAAIGFVQMPRHTDRDARAFKEKRFCFPQPGLVPREVRPIRLLPVPRDDRYIGDLSIMFQPNYDR